MKDYTIDYFYLRNRFRKKFPEIISRKLKCGLFVGSLMVVL